MCAFMLSVPACTTESSFHPLSLLKKGSVLAYLHPSPLFRVGTPESRECVQGMDEDLFVIRWTRSF